MENHQHLLWYLDNFLRLKGPNTELMTAEPWDSEQHLPWNRETCLFVLTYVVHFCSNVEHCEFTPEIMALDQIAESVHAWYIKQQEQNDGDQKSHSQEEEGYVDEINKKRQDFSEMLVNSFFPNVVPRFFIVPKLHQLPANDKHLKRNEILAGFIDFLLQVLYHEAITSDEQRNVLTSLREQLSFLLAVLGDIPFQSSDHDLGEDVEDLLVEFEILANEAGTLVYDHVFHVHLVETIRFGARANALTEKFELLNAKIKEHCIKFAELPLSVISRPRVVDSFFIIHSLMADIENLMNSRLDIIHDDFTKEQIKTLHDELTLVQTFINDSKGPIVETEALIQIRDLAYEIEYLISSHVTGIMHVWYLNLRLLSLNQKIKLARMGLQQNSEMHDSEAMSAFDNEVSFRRTEDPVTMDDNFFLEFHSDITQKILKELIGKEKERFIIILGMPGIGKTIIASKLFHCREASDHFDIRVWCMVPEIQSLRNLLIQIWMCVASNPDKNTISKKNAKELSENIKDILRGKRYLIVLDDVSCALGNLACFPANGNGSRLLITTQEKDDSGHEVPLLSDDQCWDLLVKKVFLNGPCPSELLSIGKRIASRCSGIPLAVVNAAEILVSLEKEISVWETVEEKLDMLLLDSESYWKKKLELSYKHLPHYLKPCFLYFATFPKDTEISKKQLVSMWIAQGYIQNNKWKSQDKTAEMYLSYMIKRGLVLGAKSGTGSRIKTVKIHDLFHEFCVRKAKEDNFHTSTNGFSMYNNHQHLSIPSASSISLRPFGVHCRSLGGCATELSSSFQTMPLLKILDVYPNEYSSRLYPRFDLPIQLKYLGVSDLPKGMVDNFASLESLHVRSNKTVVIPSVLLRMTSLRHVAVKPSAEFEEDCSISDTLNVRSLSFVRFFRNKDEEILKYLPHLLKLKCICGGDVIFPNYMKSLLKLESLKICLEISLTDIIQVPNFNFPDTLKELCLSGAILTREHMGIIGELRYLKVLKLENHTFVGDEWVVSHYEFRKLRVLKIESRDLRVWRSSQFSLPKLKCLVVTGCTKLEKISTATAYYCFSRLKRIEVMKCGPHVYFWLVKTKYINKSRVIDVVTDKNLEPLVLQEIQLHDEETLTDPPSTKHLSKYLKQNSPTKHFVVHYVLHFHSNLDDHSEFLDVVTGLDRIARSYFETKDRLEGYGCCSYETEKKEGEFSELLVNSFLPKVQKFFKVLKSHQLSDKDKHLNQNEILAAFFDFLIQVLHHQENISPGEEQLYALLRKQLSFHLAVLWDTPFQSTHPVLVEQVKNLLEEFELLANEAGTFICSCAFPIRLMDSDWYYAETNNLLVKAELLNATIKHHCDNFSALPMSVVPTPRSVVDSFFIIDSLIEDIDNLENQEINLIDDNERKSQIRMLKVELNTSKGVIKVSEQNEALIQIRELAYQAEYLINSHVVGNVPDWYLNLRLPPIVNEIKIMNTRLQCFKKMQDNNVMTKATDGKESTKHDTDFLSFNDDVEENILNDLIRRLKTSRQIILLHGMPGLGKTTAATKLYNRPEISEYFDRRAWCVVSQVHNLKALFVQILKDIVSGDNEVLKKETTELGVCIHKTLHRKRYLIVLDDVWESDVLDELLRYLPDDGMGSRVIVTSRVKGVVADDSICHTLPLLSNEQCWDLLKKKVFPKESCPSQLEHIGKQISEKCCGIPLAIVSTAGILANLERGRSVWERVAEQLDKLLLDDQGDYKRILELSYEHLPCNIKPCFLYLATFQEDAEISRKELTCFWMAQGFIPKEEKKSPEEIAEIYFVDLINRNLVMPAKRRWDGGTRTCRIHDLLRDMCVAKAKEENFIIKITKDFSIYENHQVVCLPSAQHSILRPFGHRCRSFRDFNTYQSSYFGTMPVLKTVELPPRKWNSDMYPRFDLPVVLRYLVIGDLQIRTVANLVNLEFIRVQSERIVVVPWVILRMVKLRQLLIRDEAEFEEDYSSDMTETTNIRSLSYVILKEKKDQDILRHSPHLTKLKCQIRGYEILFPDLTALAELESLRIDYEYLFSGEILLSESSFPTTIKKLCLRRSKLPWEKMSIIGNLLKLEVLKLEWDAFVGEEWETNDDEFQELRFLKLVGLKLKEWRSESSHFPRLEQLVIRSCHDLEEIPTDLGYIQSLQRIEVINCDSERLKTSAKEIENEQRENANTQLQVITVK